jgi:Do/DeqQ family serine protease
MKRLQRAHQMLPWLFSTAFLITILLLVSRLGPTPKLVEAEGPSATSETDRGALPLSDLDRLSNTFSAVVDKVKPSVVHIQAIRSGESLAAELQRLFADQDVQLRPIAGTGSGVIINPDGFIVTNNHVIDLADVVRVTLADGRKYRADVTGVDRMTDLAVLKINADHLHAANLGDSDMLKVGNLVLAIGSPFRLTHSVSHGIVSALGRTDVDVDIDYQNWIQTDAPINPGNSGGPLINTRGEVIGLSVAIATDTGGHQGVGFAIPSNTLAMVTDFLIKGEKIARGYLGVSVRPVEPKFADAYGLDTPGGAFVEGVLSGSPAERGGLREEDIILAVDGKPISTRQQFQDIIARTAPGATIEASIWRDGSRDALTLVVGTQPEGFSTMATQRTLDRGDDEDRLDEGTVGRSAEAAIRKNEAGEETEFPQIGLTVAAIAPAYAIRTDSRGQGDGQIVVRSVDSTGEAFLAGLAKGQIILSANGLPVHQVAQLREKLTDEALFKGVRLKVRHGTDTFYTVLQVR